MNPRAGGPAIALIALVLACSTPPTISQSSPAPCGAAPSPAPSDAGSIAGTVSYPADVILPMTVYAIPVTAIHASSIRAQANCFRAVETVLNQGSFHILDLAPGNYDVIAASIRAVGLPVASDARTTHTFEGAYTRAVACGLNVGCDDHTLLPVTVQSGKETTGVKVTDWYAEPDAFPNVPGASSPATLPPEPAAFSTAGDAARYYAQSFSGGVYTDTTCPVNRACVSLGAQVGGTNAAYFPVVAGSNQDHLSCVVYLYTDSAGWHFVDALCKATTPVFPSFQASGTVAGLRGDNSCIHFRYDQGRTGRVVGCLAVGTHVNIDGGPAYANDPDPALNPLDKLWWHLKGYGWMVHLYLRDG